MPDLSESDLCRADLVDFNLSKVDFSSADLSRADMSVSDISCAILNHADLRDSAVYFSDLSGAELETSAIGKHLVTIKRHLIDYFVISRHKNSISRIAAEQIVGREAAVTCFVTTLVRRKVL